MKTGSITLRGYSLGAFVVSLSIITPSTSGWLTSTKALPQVLSPEQVLAVQGTIYYVAPDGNDSNPGTKAWPWCTIQKAADTMVAGDTVYVRAGTYEEQVIPQHSGSAGNYITYAAYSGETLTIDGNSITLPAYETGLFVVEDTDYIKVSGLRIVNAGPHDNNAGIYVDNSHHIIIENNRTYNTVSSGIGVWDCSNIIIAGNEVRLACNDGEQEDITVSGTDTFEIKYNHVHEGGPGTNGGEGITVKGGATNGRIYKNHVHDLTRGERTCIYVDAWGTTATSNIEIYQNVIHNCGAGISLASEDGGLVRNIRIYNNIVYDNQTNGLEIGNWGEPGILVHPVESVTFTNNTVYNNGSTGWGGGFFNENPDVTDIVVRNNIFSQNATSQIVNESTASLTVDHNLIDGTQEYTYAISGTDYVVGDPLFVNAAAADFHLQRDSPAIDNGSATDAPVNDFDGQSRPYGAGYDIGADEYRVFTASVYLPIILKNYVP
jgi:parallel beta-helix repeat protein